MAISEHLVERYPVHVTCVPAILDHIDPDTELIYNSLQTCQDPEILCVRKFIPHDPDYAASLEYYSTSHSMYSVITTELLKHPQENMGVTIISRPKVKHSSENDARNASSTIFVQYDTSGTISKATVHGQIKERSSIHVSISITPEYIQGWHEIRVDTGSHIGRYNDISDSKKSRIELVLKGFPFVFEISESKLKVIADGVYHHVPLSIGDIRNDLLDTNPRNVHRFPTHLFRSEKIK